MEAECEGARDGDARGGDASGRSLAREPAPASGLGSGPGAADVLDLDDALRLRASASLGAPHRGEAALGGSNAGHGDDLDGAGREPSLHGLDPANAPPASSEYWRRRADALARELDAARDEAARERAHRMRAVADAERRVLSSEVRERSRLDELETALSNGREELAGLRAALEALAIRNVRLERGRHDLEEERFETSAFLESLAAQRAADDVVKRRLDRENGELRRKLAELAAYVNRET